MCRTATDSRFIASTGLAKLPLTLPILLGRLPTGAARCPEDQARRQPKGGYATARDVLAQLFCDHVGARVGELYDEIGLKLRPPRLAWVVRGC